MRLMLGAAIAAACLATQVPVSDDTGVVVDLGGAVVASRGPIRYPREAMQNAVQGTVVIQVAVDETGRTAKVDVVSGPERLRPLTVASIWQWIFATGEPGRDHEIRVEFRMEPALVEAMRKEAEARGSDPRPQRRLLAGRVVKSVSPIGIPAPARVEVLARLGIKVGDVLTNGAMDRAEEELRKLDPRIQLKILAVGEDEAQVFVFGVTAGR